MLSRIYYAKFIKHFFGLKVTRKKYLVHLALSAILRTLVFLLIPLMASEIIEGLEEQNYQYAFISIGLFLLSAVAYLFLHRYNYWAYYINALSIHNVLQQKILKKVLEFDVCFSTGVSKANLVSTAFRDVDHARQAPDFLCDAVVSIFGALVATIILCVVDIRIGLIVTALLILSLIDFIYHTKKRDQSRTNMLNYSDELTGLYSQVIDGYREVQALNLENSLRDYQKNIKSTWSKYFHAERVHRDLAASATPLLIGVGRIIIYFFCAGLILGGEYDIATLILVLGYYEEIIAKYDEICSNIDNISRSYVAIERLYRLLRAEAPFLIEFGDNRTDKITGIVKLDKVNFEYKSVTNISQDSEYLEHSKRKYPNLKNVSFEATPGTITAIVGKSGSGKSTIFRLLLRFYKVEDGKILLDGHDIYDYTEDIYTNNVSMMSQKPFMFDMTIRENLSLVDSNHKNQVTACKKAGIHNDITKLPKGYDTILKRDGTNLSAGQKQLLSLARVLLSRAEVLLFDEVTASLDSFTTDKVVSSLKQIKEGHTIMMITHKPELMRMADQIIVIDKGKVVGKGKHSELIKTNQAYQALQKYYHKI